MAFDYKAHSTETVSRVLELASVVVWADRTADGTVSLSPVEDWPVGVAARRRKT